MTLVALLVVMTLATLAEAGIESGMISVFGVLQSADPLELMGESDVTSFEVPSFASLFSYSGCSGDHVCGPIQQACPLTAVALGSPTVHSPLGRVTVRLSPPVISMTAS